jgi:hypothetical protein
MAPRIKSASYIFAIINKPVDFKIPYLVGSYLSDPLLEELYDQQHYENNPYLTKRQLEKLWIMPATGPRYSMLKIPVPDFSTPPPSSHPGPQQESQSDHPSSQLR